LKGWAFPVPVVRRRRFFGIPVGEKVFADTPNLRRRFDSIGARPTFASTAPQLG
jgi:hypothetical protein